MTTNECSIITGTRRSFLLQQPLVFRLLLLLTWSSWIIWGGCVLPVGLATTTTTAGMSDHREDAPVSHALLEYNDNYSEYYIGTGIYDITGPAAQINFMGYAKSSQTGHGIHQRLYARSFVVSMIPPSANKTTHIHQDDEESDESYSQLDPNRTICFVSIDTGMGSDLLTQLVVERFQVLWQDHAAGTNHRPSKISSSPPPPCHLENLSISGTHTHSAPAGFLQYVLYQITSLGYSHEVMDTFVEGTAQSLMNAVADVEIGSISFTKGLLHDSNINRSPTSYLLNPLEERQLYAEQGDTDKTMAQLAFRVKTTTPSRSTDTAVGRLKGLLNWFAVHGTSMNSSNVLISGDNRGYAAYLMEKHINGNNTLPGAGDFVAAFASTNLGDVSPNTAGPRCQDTGLSCDLLTSTCNGKTTLCIASGPGNDMKESTQMIGQQQFHKAAELLNDAADPHLQHQKLKLSGSVDFRHAFVDMVDRPVQLQNGTVVKTCAAALGYAFAAGTTDGPGDFDFTQGENSSNPFWNVIGSFLSKPTVEQKTCQWPKPILLNTGGAELPYSWDPKSVPISIFRIGNVFILNVPAELTTMAGRRLRRAVHHVLAATGIKKGEVVIAGLANSYTHYVTTFEEYEGQRYEAASTLYGPHTLAAYIQEFCRILQDMLEGNTSTSDEPPQNLERRQVSLIPPAAFDRGRDFGSVVVNTHDEYVRGSDTAYVSFKSSNPRHNQRIQSTFLSVDYMRVDGTWTTKYVDGDWSTTYQWKHQHGILGASFAEIYWEVPENADLGTYRICHFGTRKTLVGPLQWLVSGSVGWTILEGFVSLINNANDSPATESSVPAQFVQKAAEVLEWTDLTKLVDFHGCSNTFSVRS